MTIYIFEIIAGVYLFELINYFMREYSRRYLSSLGFDCEVCGMDLSIIVWDPYPLVSSRNQKKVRFSNLDMHMEECYAKSTRKEIDNPHE